jgi:glycosyltransferase involved in cell wall biosynthesis
MPGPLVTILLPCFDAQQFLDAALESLTRQTYGELDILAIDDGSRDGTPRILDRWAARDPRVRVLRNGANRGLIETLNRGVAEARGAFLARMDADDIASPKRIEAQVRLFEVRPSLGVVGTAVRLVNADGDRPVRALPVGARTPAAARFMALFATPIAHPTLMAQTELMRAHPYGTSARSLHTEDYELFTRMLEAGVEFANVGEPLVSMRFTTGSVSRRYEDIQITNFVACARHYLERVMGITPDPAAHRVFVNRMNGDTTARDLRAGLRLLDRVEAEFVEREPADTSEIAAIAAEHRVDILVQALRRGGVSARLATVPSALRRADALLSKRGRTYLARKLRTRF